VLVRQNAPVFGASASPYQAPGKWQVGLSLRTLVSDDHYVGTVRQDERHELGNYVINRQNLIDVGVTYALSPRASVSASVPVVFASWSIPMPVRPVPGPRVQQDARGVGDLIFSARSWVLAPDRHARGNVSVGLGLKVPTGASDVRDTYPDINGQNPADKVVDMSIQPGDGGWGVAAEVQAFHNVGKAVLFASGTYLANPRNTNGQPSIIPGLGVPITPAVANRATNSVPDQYLARAGVAAPAFLRGLGLSAALRVEGQARYDVFGRSDGFRRPGTEMFVEPGLSYARGTSSWWASVPIAFYRNRHPDPYTGAPGDATFPNAIVLVGYSRRFGR
jgi:hypothetical protein